MNQVAPLQKRSLVDSMAAKYDMEPAAFVNAIKATVIKGDCSNEQFAAFLMVAKEYDLNPLTKEIYAFPDRGGITPIVSVDGWMNLINSHPQFDGMEFVDNVSDGKLHSVECKMYRKDRQRPTTVIEYMSECFRQTDPWKKWPNRMLRHKAAIQCARYAFGFSGIMEPDEYERMKDITPAKSPTLQDRLREAREVSQDAGDAREGFDRSFVQSETETALTGEIIENDTNSGPPSRPEADAPAPDTASAEEGSVPAESSSPNSDATDSVGGPASEAGDPSPPSGSPAHRDPETEVLIRYARDVLPMAGASDANGQALFAVEKEWADEIKKLSEAGKERAKAISRSMRAIFNGNTSLESAIEYFSDALGCDQTEIGGSA